MAKKKKTTEIPVEACLIQLTIEKFGETETDEATGVRSRKFAGKANSGKPFLRPFIGHFAIDMAGLSVNRQDLPVLRDHWPDQIAGFTTKIEKGDKGIDVEGVLLDATPAGKESLALLENGFPMQMSVYVPPTKITRLEAGASVKVNGHTLKGPGMVFDESTLREVTLTALGADEATGASVLSGARAPGVRRTVQVLHEEHDMAEQEPITAALLKTEHADVHTALLAEGVEAERARVKEIRGLTKHVKPELLNQAIDEGWTVDKAKSQFLAYFEEHAEARLQVLRDEHGDEGSGNDDEDPEQTSFDEGKAAGKNAPKKLAELKDGEDKWKLQWEHGDAELDMDTEKLHEEFSSFETYAAYKKNPDPADARRTG